jgi:dTDP-4-dehydrorhamnose reductase
MHVLVVGNRGMLGSCLCRVLRASGRKVTGTDIDEFDITDLEETRREIDKISPDILVNCAAYTDVDGCESNRELAFSVNAEGPKNLGAVTAGLGIRIMHVSTDFVFDGSKKTPYREDDATGPLSVYGKSKLQGEAGLSSVAEDYVIVRTSWLYGRDGGNFVRTILRLAEERDTLDVVDDQRGSPTYALDLAGALRDLSGAPCTGIVHYSNSGDCTWYDFASRIVALAGKPVTVRPTTTDRFPRPAVRPAYSVLDLSKVTRLLGQPPRPWEEALRAFIQGEGPDFE